MSVSTRNNNPRFQELDSVPQQAPENYLQRQSGGYMPPIPHLDRQPVFWPANSDSGFDSQPMGSLPAFQGNNMYQFGNMAQDHAISSYHQGPLNGSGFNFLIPPHYEQWPMSSPPLFSGYTNQRAQWQGSNGPFDQETSNNSAYSPANPNLDQQDAQDPNDE